MFQKQWKLNQPSTLSEPQASISTNIKLTKLRQKTHLPFVDFGLSAAVDADEKGDVRPAPSRPVFSA